MRSIRALALLSIFPIQIATAQAPGVQWGPAPPVFPAGARFAVLAGDPSKAGEYTVRLEMPNNYTIAPHYHPTDEHITVIQGTFLVGMGDTVNAAKARTLKVGDFATAMASQHHFGIARGRTIVQVNGMGPFQLTYVNPADDPQKKVSKK
ncbi:MAG TPA: cupin domain-containing protein [Gemmatimonadaceae bacterium]|nr:cupin domain-containing protein [Gemmatimonadaceae bacterium]